MSSEITPDPRGARAQRYLDVIDLMVDLGAGLIQELRPAEPTPTPVAERAQIFDRTSRAIRLCMLLADRFEQVVAEPAQRQARRSAARRQVARSVENDIARAPASPADKEALTAELHERLDRLDSIEDLESRPFRDIVQEIVRDLGLQNSGHGPVWPRRTPADLDALAASPDKPGPAAPKPPAEPVPDEPPASPQRRPASLMEWALQRADDG